jgi:hypothetical protein
MKKFFLLALAFCLVAPIGLAQVNERAPQGNSSFQALASSNNTTLVLGDLNWYLDTEGLTGDIRMLGVCFDPGTGHIFCTGAFDMTIAYLYEIDFVNGVLVNTWTQPSANWGGWGWRDLASDGKYIYTGDPNVPYIVQIDPSNGQPTGVQYGPFPITPCRALAYDPVSDSFWTASFSSSIYQCFRNNTYNTYSGQGLTHYGAGMEEKNNMIWWWSQDGATLSLASEYDPASQTLTGRAFEATTPLLGGTAGGAGCHEVGGNWELIGMFQGSPDHVGAFDLEVGTPPALKVSPDEIDSRVGGTVTFDLNAGAPNAGRFYVIFAGASGSMPGTPLPGGSTVLPVNWDAVTNLLLGLPFFYGNLDGAGHDMKSLPVSPFFIASDITVTFAYALNGPPWDFASNPEDLLVTAPPDEYLYDDGETDNLLGWTAGGDMAWMHYFKAVGGADTLTELGTAFGSALYPGYNPGNGTPATLYVWDDPTNDNDPLDAALLQKIDVSVVNVDTDIINYFPLGAPQAVNGGFFIGANQVHNPGQFVAPMDTDTPYGGEAWIAGMIGGIFDPYNIANNLPYVYEMSGIGWPAYFLLRAK